MGELQSWLKSDRNYWAGLQLLRDHKASAFVIELLESGPDEYNTPKLSAQIEKLLNKQPAPRTFEPIKVAGNSVSMDPAPGKPDQPATDQQSSKDLEKSLRIKGIIKKLFTEIIHLRGKLPVLPEGEQLFECAKTILQKDLKRRDLWDQLHYFEKNDKWFDEQDENQAKDFDPMDKIELEKKIKNLMSNRSKAATYLKKPLPAAQKKFYEEKIAELNAEIDKLKVYRNG